MNDRSRRFAYASMAALVIAASTAALGSAASAQAPVREIELVAGSCDAPAGTVTALGDLSTDADTADLAAGMGAVVQALGPVVDSGRVAMPVSLQEITAAAHALRVVERGRPPGRLVACGELEGSAGMVGDLQVGLAGVDDSGLYGVAWLHDNGDGTTDTSVAIASEGPAVTSMDDGGEVEVAIRKSLYVPNPLEVGVGTTVTWINEDVLPHTTTSTDGAFDSGYMAQDARFSYTFDAPGDYPIFCVYHPRMRALVVVS